MVTMMEVDSSDESFFGQDASDNDSEFDFVDENVAVGPSNKRDGTVVAAKKSATQSVAVSKPSKPKAKAKAPKKTEKVLKDSTNKNDEDEVRHSKDVPTSGMPAAGKNTKTIEQIYQKKSQLEHILLRPDTYVGSVVRVSQQMFVLNASTGRIVQKEIAFTPGLFKIFDEIVVNAADNKQRDPTMDKVSITIDAESNSISVENNGNTIPVAMHKEHNCYVPTLIFGHLLTGSNFDDAEKKTTGGRNGYGAKLANIFSTEFIVECTDVTNKIHFRQVFRENMSIAEEPVVSTITKASVISGGDKTKITFKPDLKRFSMDVLDEDTVALLSKRAYDIAGVMNVSPGKRLSVVLNGQKLAVKTFKDYVSLYDGINPPVAYEQVNDRWEVGVSVSDGSFQQISFVNAICTSKGGQHATYIADKLATRLSAALKKKNKSGIEIKGNQIKNHLCVFVNCLIDNPAFDSQTKECLTTRSKDFGSDCTLSDKFLKQVEKSDIVDSIMSYVRFKQGEALKRKGGAKKKKLTGIDKLDDANFAGTAKSKDCTLIITEGDSAKSLAMSGLSVVGRDFYGVYPLKGKPLNVREASHRQVMENEEIKDLVDILGLKYECEYDEATVKNLRYGHLMIMADQDTDGSHIKGLVINVFHHFWPSLLNVPGFLKQFITPIVKVTKGKRSQTFFTLPEYEEFKQRNNDGKGYTIKYYKGLGTSTNAEAKDYFSNLDQHEVHFSTLSADFNDAIPDASVSSSGDDLIKMAFSKSRVEDRKAWLNKFQKGTYLNYFAKEGGVPYSDFINKELVLFSMADNMRSIPHLIDGFKPSQRKVLFSCFKRKLKNEVKVAQLAGYIGEHSAYHHGEASLAGTIINMAQNYCGSNNINLLTPSGQFGTRRLGGADHASPRYIFTCLEKITRTLFHPDDDALLNYLNDDGLVIEPEFYVPVIPMLLANGADGIGTGWSTTVPNYNPSDIIANIRRIIKGEAVEKMTPYYRGFTGEIVAENGKKAGSYVVKGRTERIDDENLYISELPLKKWTQTYKRFLESLLSDKKEKEGDIKDFKENHTDDTVSFTVTATKEKIDEYEADKLGLYGKFKLTSTLSTSNMNVFDSTGRITKFGTPEDILEAFYAVRLEFYVQRKELLLKQLTNEQSMLSNKARFVEEVCTGQLVVNNRKRQDLLLELQARKYDLFTKEDLLKTIKDVNDDDEEEEEDEGSCAGLSKGYEYLLGMKLWSLTLEKIKQLRDELEKKIQVVDTLERTSPSQIWLNDLAAVEVALEDSDKEMKAAAAEEIKAQKKSQMKKDKKRGGKTCKSMPNAKAKQSKLKTVELVDESDSDSDFDVQRKEVKQETYTLAERMKQRMQISSAIIGRESDGLLNSLEEIGGSSLAPKRPAAKSKKLDVVKRAKSSGKNINHKESDDDVEETSALVKDSNRGARARKQVNYIVGLSDTESDANSEDEFDLCSD